MSDRYSDALGEYAEAFADGEALFVVGYGVVDGELVVRRLTRGEFWELACRLAGGLRGVGCVRGDRVLLAMGGNRVEDVALRLAAVMVGVVPVTVNWQADTPERVVYKARQTGCTLVVRDEVLGAAERALLSTELPYVAQVGLEALAEYSPLEEGEFCGELGSGDVRIVIFTSGTTGDPKGVELTYRSYRANAGTFASFLGVYEEDSLGLFVVNPLHHTNSTAMTDWGMRRPGTVLHVMERYTTGYWRALVEAAESGYDRLVAPMVSRHFDFLESLAESDRLPVDEGRLRAALGRVDCLVGSAPVGPSTVARLKRFAGGLPVVRFGSTETCLQVMGIACGLSEEVRMAGFEAGWEHVVGGEAQCGYYIGRPHAGYTECRVVREIEAGTAGFMVDCEVGESGYLVTRGENLMRGYVGDEAATQAVCVEGGWYTGLRDICFALRNEVDGELDFFWVSRDSSLLIRGGANYAYDQVNAELIDFVVERFGLGVEAFDLAVVGLRVDSEHEDACCVTVELKEGVDAGMRATLESEFLSAAKGAVSKGAKPDYLRLAAIPRNFKGAVLVPELRVAFGEFLKGAG